MSEQRQPGYYWVRMGNDWMVAQTYTFPDGLMVWATKVDDGYLRDEDIDEIGSRITPSMKYTEEDLRSYGRNCATERFESEDRFADWLKQRNTAK